MKNYSLPQIFKSQTEVGKVIEYPEVSDTIRLVGSVAVNGAGNDIDFAILDTAGKVTKAYLKLNGWNPQYEDAYGDFSDFFSVRKDDINLLVCRTEREYNRFVKGAEYASILTTRGIEVDKKMRVFLCLVSVGADEDEINESMDKV